MHNSMPPWQRTCVAVLLAAAWGCSSGPKTMHVWGTVTYDGQPVPQGTIIFVPIEGTRGPSTGGDFTNGAYDLAAAVGPRSGGTYQVKIQAIARTGKTVPNVFKPGGPPLDLSRNYVPAIYNTQSTLKVTIADDPRQNQFDFHLNR